MYGGTVQFGSAALFHQLTPGQVQTPTGTSDIAPIARQKK